MGCVTIERQKSFWRDVLRSYKVEIDGHIVGKVRNGQTVVFDVPAGLHEICLKIDWCSSQTLEISGEGHTQLLCAPGGTALTAIPDVIIDTDHYITLVRAHQQ